MQPLQTYFVYLQIVLDLQSSTCFAEQRVDQGKEEKKEEKKKGKKIT